MRGTYNRWALGALAGGLTLGSMATGLGTARAARTPSIAPTIFVGDALIQEGNLGVHVAKIPITLSEPLAFDSSFTVETIDDAKGGAVAGVDYRPLHKVKKIRAGVTGTTVSVRILGDTQDDPYEQVRVLVTPLDTPPVAMIKNSGVVLVVDDDDGSGPTISSSGLRLFEGDSGHQKASVQLTLSDPQTSDIAVTWTAVAESASPFTDYKAGSKTTIIKAGKLQQTANILIYGDTLVEGHEQLHVLITSVSGGGGLTVDPSPDSGLVYIVNDDGDTDGDGLVDTAEGFVKTDSANSDSDGDGLTDGAEVRQFFTNPNQTDTDGDGFDDLVELKSGTNPLDPLDHPAPMVDSA